MIFATEFSILNSQFSIFRKTHRDDRKLRIEN